MISDKVAVHRSLEVVDVSIQIPRQRRLDLVNIGIHLRDVMFKVADVIHHLGHISFHVCDKLGGVQSNLLQRTGIRVDFQDESIVVTRTLTLRTWKRR